MNLRTPTLVFYTFVNIDLPNQCMKGQDVILVNQSAVILAHRPNRGGSSLKGHSDPLSWGSIETLCAFSKAELCRRYPLALPGYPSHVFTPPRHELHVPPRDHRCGLIPLASDHLAYCSSPRVFSSGRSPAIRIYRLIRS